MSEPVKRFTIDGDWNEYADENGKYVKHDDYAVLERQLYRDAETFAIALAEVDRRLKEANALEAERDRLRAALSMTAEELFPDGLNVNTEWEAITLTLTTLRASAGMDGTDAAW